MDNSPSTASAMLEATDESQANARVVGELYDAFVTGDADAAARLIAPDYVLHVPGRGLNAGEYWGVEGFRQFMSNIAAHNGGVFEMEVPTFAVSGEHAFTREVIRMNRAHDPGRVFTLRIANWLKLRGGKLAESWVIPEDQRAYDEYWSRPPHAPPDAPAPSLAAPALTGHRRGILDAERAISPENGQLLAAMYDRFWSGDADGMRAVIADDVVVNIVGRSAMSDVYRGWDGYVQFRDRLMAMAGTKYKLDVVALAASDRDVFAVEYIRMNRRWDPTVQEIFVLMHFEIEHGKITRMDDFPLDTYAWERFYCPPSKSGP
jgi:ketosteroid isomerase-like protein